MDVEYRFGSEIQPLPASAEQLFERRENSHLIAIHLVTFR
jgi:hypothetical protein